MDTSYSKVMTMVLFSFQEQMPKKVNLEDLEELRKRPGKIRNARLHCIKIPHVESQNLVTCCILRLCRESETRNTNYEKPRSRFAPIIVRAAQGSQ